jgi:hypothetical protein
MILLAEQNPQTHSRVAHLLVEVHVALTGRTVKALAALEHKLVVFRVEMLEEFSARSEPLQAVNALLPILDSAH